MLLMHIAESFDRAVWSWRDVVRELEKTRPDKDLPAKRSFEHMHEAARHVIHSSEILATAISVTEAVTRKARLNQPQEHEHDPTCAKILDDLEFCTSLLTSFRNRSQALEKRVDNEINLVSRREMAPRCVLRLC